MAAFLPVVVPANTFIKVFGVVIAATTTTIITTTMVIIVGAVSWLVIAVK
jgi:hypothetical protein